jgi:hypothetical protein
MRLSKRCWRNLTCFCVLPMLLLLAGCAQHEALPTAEESTPADQHLPFDGTSDKGGIFPTGSLSPTAIPSGTPVTVHLQSLLSSATSRSGDSFEAVLVEPLIVRGQMLAPRGAILGGKILEANAAREPEEPGYMRLALTTLSLNGKPVPIQTSSIFLKGGFRQKRNPATVGAGNSKGLLIDASAGPANADATPYVTVQQDVGVSPERRLTFRLARLLPLDF